jgi:hypothetical protein
LHFNTAKDLIEKFISETFHNVEVDKLTLEDLFTLLDKAVIGKEYFGGYAWQDLHSIRKGLVHTLLVLINSRMEDNRSDIPLFKKFGQFVIDCQLNRDKQAHSIGVLSLNWDTIFESVIDTLGTQDRRNNISLNYCMFYDSIRGNNINDLYPGKKSGYIKVMKLHGSINWLYCPNCWRLYIDKKRFKSIGIEHRVNCPKCSMTNMGHELILEEMIITPTMLKELQNHHLKLTWQHAFMELNQAGMVFFIGYSFPQADYELRYLLKKALNKDAKLYSVLYHPDETNGTKERYENFFGKDIEFNFDGFENWWSQFRMD